MVLPTFNERLNIRPITLHLLPLQEKFDLELLFVDDDSADGSADEVRELARLYGCVRLIRRVGRYGLSSAIKEGILNATGEVVVVMDSDGQHQPSGVFRIVEALRCCTADLVIGSRFHTEASISGLSEQRKRNSNFANAVARFSLPRYRHLSDYMSGFFALSPKACIAYVRQVDVNGFKFLYELLAISRGHLKVSEIPLNFQPRVSGESKLNLAVVWDLGISILHTLLLRMIPRRAVSFALVGFTGIGVHRLLFGFIISVLQVSFEQAQTVAVVGAASSNYLVNNTLTFRSQQLKGAALLFGLVRFLLVTSLGMVANIGVSSAFHRLLSSWCFLLRRGLWHQSGFFRWHQELA